MSRINNPKPDQDLSGYVPYTGATSNVDLGSNDLIVDTDTLFVNSTSDRVGINFNNPGANLHVVGTDGMWIDSDGTKDGFHLRDDGTKGSIQCLTNGSTGRLLELQALNFDFWGTTDRIMYLDGPNTRVGIGTGTPSYTLDVNGTSSADKVLVAGQTDTDTHLDIDRTANPTGVSSGTHAQITETVNGTTIDLGGTTLKVDTDFDDGIAHVSHYGTHLNMDLTSGTAIACFPLYVTADLGGSATSLISGLLHLDSQTAVAVGKTAGIELGISGDRAGGLYGAWTQAKNNGRGDAVGYTGYGNNIGTGATHNATGVYGYATSSNGLAAGMYANSFTRNSKHFSLFAEGHLHTTQGNLYIYENTAISEVGNKTHIDESSDGNLYVENDVEVDGTLYADGDAEIAGELKGSRQSFSFGYNKNLSSDTYIKSAGNTITSATIGYVMPRAGSIVGIGFCTNINNLAVGGDLKAVARINGSDKLSETLSFAGTGDKSGYATAARNTHTFTAGQKLAVYTDKVSGTYMWQNTVVNIEVVFDT